MHLTPRALLVALLALAAVDCPAQDTEAPVYLRRGFTQGPTYGSAGFAAGQFSPYGGFVGPGGYFGGFYPYGGFFYPGPFGLSGGAARFRGHYYSRPYPTHLNWQEVRSRAPHVCGPGCFHGYPVEQPLIGVPAGEVPAASAPLAEP